MAITIKDVAEAAGVSTAAVSKVLHGRGKSVRVGEVSADRIRKAARELNYFPNALARNLRCSQTHTIGVLFENLDNFGNGPLYPVHLLDGVARAVFPRHYRITILPELDHQDMLGCFGDGQLDGVIWCKLTRDSETMEMIRRCPIPIVALNARQSGEPTSALFVSCDNDGGTKLAVDHLVGLGHRRIAFLREREEIGTPDCDERMEAFHKHMAFHGLKVEDRDILTWQWQMHEFSDWWNSRPDVTAIYCWSERAAGVFLKRAIPAGVRVPDDISLVGFDSTPYCETLHPRLTAVRQPISEMAQTAANLLLDLLSGERPVSGSLVVSCDFDVRDSTAPPRS
jgi:LacI family transcriptional regulator